MSTVMESVRSTPGLAGPLRRIAQDLVPLVSHAVVTDGFRRASASDAPASVARTSFDPREHATLADPYRWLPQLHEQPLWVNERINAWIITGYEDLRRAASDHAALSSAEGIFLQATQTKVMITRDRPDHARLRGVTAKLFTRDAVRALEPDLARMTDEGIDRLVRGDTDDIVDALCAPIPMSAIALLLGIPPQRWRDFRHWSEPMSRIFSPGTPVEVLAFAARATPRMARFRGLIEEEIERRGSEPQDDVLGAVRRALDAGELDATEAAMYAVIMLVAGQETTANLLGSTFAALSTRPELYARLREDRSLLPAAVEEFVRWSSPVQWVGRWTREPYEVGGHMIPANARVLLPWMFANRDPRRFPDPDRLDIDRDTKGHLGFGHGIHICLGQHLARVEAVAILNSFLDRVERLEPAGPVRPSTTVSLNGPARVPVRVTAAA